MFFAGAIVLAPVTCHGQGSAWRGVPPGTIGGEAANREIALDFLFAGLAKAKDEAIARRIANSIWQIWFKAPDADVKQLMQRVQFARRAGLFKQALADLDRVVQIAPDYAEGWNQRATVYFMMGRHGSSVSDIERVLRLEPRHFGALSGLGMIHMRAQNWKSAIAAFEKALEIHPFLNERSLLPQLRQKLEGQPL